MDFVSTFTLLNGVEVQGEALAHILDEHWSNSEVPWHLEIFAVPHNCVVLLENAYSNGHGKEPILLLFDRWGAEVWDVKMKPNGVEGKLRRLDAVMEGLSLAV